jgi:amino-acid N-acetyltransferase
LNRVATAVSRSTEVAEQFGEKEFYLDDFRAHTLCFAVRSADCERGAGGDVLGNVARELIHNDTRILLLLGVEERKDADTRLTRLRRRLQRAVVREETRHHFPSARGRGAHSQWWADLRLDTAPEGLNAVPERIWQHLRSRPLLVALVPQADLADLAQRLAGRLRVHKLVLVEPEGGISSPAGQISFMDEAMLTAALQTGEAEWAGLARRRRTLESARAALRGGVYSVNLCSLDGLARELYTYEGSGTLFTREDYCRIERLGIDDFEEVERLIARGTREGYLKKRSPAEVAHLLLNGFGATIGAHHFAGVCGLETERYAADRAGELVGLYTITRFKGEGVGGRLIAKVLQEAVQEGLRYVFACTVEPRAQAFFERQGFRPVRTSEVPASKWIGYDESRLERLRVFRIDLVPRVKAVAARGNG